MAMQMPPNISSHSRDVRIARLTADVKTCRCYSSWTSTSGAKFHIICNGWRWYPFHLKLSSLAALLLCGAPFCIFTMFARCRTLQRLLTIVLVIIQRMLIRAISVLMKSILTLIPCIPCKCLPANSTSLASLATSYMMHDIWNQVASAVRCIGFVVYYWCCLRASACVLVQILVDILFNTVDLYRSGILIYCIWISLFSFIFRSTISRLCRASSSSVDSRSKCF